MPDIARSVRVARVVKTTKALTLLNPDLPPSVRQRLNNSATALKLLVDVDDVALLREGLDTLSRLLKELDHADGVTNGWVERITAHVESLRAVS